MNRILNQLTCARRFAGKYSAGMLALLGVMFLAASTQAQEDIRLRYFRPAPLRLTVSINTTNTGTFTNFVSLSTNISSVTLSVSNLPAGCGYDLVTTNGSAGLSVTFTNDQALSIVVNTTNLAQGEYTFYLMGTGGATNRFPLMLQSAHIWQGTNNAPFNTAFNWTNNFSWVGNNNPTTNSANDVVFGDLGAQTNRSTGNNGNFITFTNINITQPITVGSMRFGAGTYTNLYIESYFTNTVIDTNLMTTNLVAGTNIIGATNALFHHVNLNGNTLTVNGTKGFSLLRDYIAEYGNNEGSKPDRKTGLIFSGGNGAKVLVTNFNANFSILLDGGNASGDSFIAMTNIGTFVAAVNRFGMGDFQLYPNYREMNRDTNGLGAVPRQFINSVFFARTNYITANYRDPDNYTNANTRSHAIMWLNGETSGNGSGTANQLQFGLTNRILADSVCFVGANHASGNAGAARFNTIYDANATAIFRATNGTGRMSVFTVSDGGGTNAAGSNMKANVDFSTINNNRIATVDIMADRFYVARDRSIIAESNTVNYQGTVMFGRGTVDVNTAILGYQEHAVRRNNDQPQLGYCQGILTVTNQGTFKVNGELTLGYTADTNSIADCQPYDNYGRLTVAGATVIASNIVVDGGPRNYSHLEGTARQDFIRLVGANLIVSNTIANAPGQPIDSFSTERSTNVWFIAVGRTNLFCRTLSTPGTDASVIKVASIAGVTSLPATLPIISYETASSPYLKADTTGNGLTNGYLLNDTVSKSVNLYLTTNQPLSLRWVGGIDNNWDYVTHNWVPVGGGAATNFHIGDIAIFDDTSSQTNVNIVVEVVPGQTGAGVTVSNITKQYAFSGGTIAGTSLLLKVGDGSLNVSATKQGPVTLLEGSIQVEVGGSIGLTTVASNTVVNCFGAINGGLTCTGVVSIATGGTLDGPVNLVGGWISNDGTISTAPSSLVFTAGNITNSGTINVANATYTVPAGSTLANFGTIFHLNNRVNVVGFVYGTGQFIDPDGGLAGPSGLTSGVDGRVDVRPGTGLLTAGSTPTGSIGTLTIGTRFDVTAAANSGFATLLIEVDKANAQTNDAIFGDFWNNMGGRIIITNINPGLPLAAGDTLWIFRNSNGEAYENQNDADAAAQITMDPPVPGPGLQWDLTDLRGFGKIKIRTTPMVWRGNLSGDWNTNTANWLSGITFTNGVGAQFDDSVGSGSTNVTLDIIVAPAGYTYSTNIVVGVSTNYFTNTVPVSPGIVFSNSAKDYVLGGSGSIEGWTGLYKTGPGTLTIAGNMTNRYVGPTIIEEGTVVVSIFTNVSTPSPLGAPGLGARQPLTGERLILGGATLKFTGNSMNSDRGITVNPGGATIEISNSATVLAISGMFLGDGDLTKTGPGTLLLASGNSSFTNITVSDGVLKLRAAAAGRGHIILSGGSLAFTNNTSITNLINITTNAQLDNTNNTVLGGSWIGTGDVTITNIAPSILSWTRDMTNYTGDITFVGNGTNRFNNTTNGFNGLGSPSVVFNLGSSARLENFTGGDTNGAALAYHLGGLAGGVGSSLAGRFSNTVVTASGTIYSIGGKGVDTAFGGTILDGLGSGTVAIVKVGTGTLALNGVNTYTGSTTVSNGTLGGSGSIAGPVIVASGGTIAPGNSVGTLTVSNNVTLGGATLMELNPAGSDLLRVTGTLTGGGTLTVTNIGPTLFNNTTFKLFSIPVTGFASITLPGAPYAWTTNLAVDGTITLVSGGATNNNPTTITGSLSGNTLTLSWPADHTGWTLQTQTNALAVGISTNWSGVAGSSATNSVDITLDPTQPTVFYRLVYP